MPEKREPKLRTVEKIKPPYSLNNFPKSFPYRLGKEIIYLLATKSEPTLEGPEWEHIFADCIKAQWKPSNVGLDDIILGNCAWSAKTVKAKKPDKIRRIRLISGRNSPLYSFGSASADKNDPASLGEQILSIWNNRVSAIRAKYAHLRTVILIKSSTLEVVSVFEFETLRYEPELYVWSRNVHNNLIGCTRTGVHRFTWQPHGSQFTIIEDVPESCLILRIKKPPKLNKGIFLSTIGFDKNWITVEKRNGGHISQK